MKLTQNINTILKASILIVVLNIENALFMQFFFFFFFFAMLHAMECQLKQDNYSIPRINLLSLRFFVAEVKWLFQGNLRNTENQENSEILNHDED